MANAPYIDTDAIQPWFVWLKWSNKGKIVVMQNSLAEILKPLRFFCNEWYATATVYHPSNGEVGALRNGDDLARDFSKMGATLLREMAHITPDCDYGRVQTALTLALGEVPQEQQEAELKTLAARIAKELAALEIQKEINTNG